MEATQPARLGDFEFDAIIKRPETLSSKIPDYATEEGYSASDHICLEAVTLDVTAVISNAPITWGGPAPGHHRAGYRALSRSCGSCGEKNTDDLYGRR